VLLSDWPAEHRAGGIGSSDAQHLQRLADGWMANNVGVVSPMRCLPTADGDEGPSNVRFKGNARRHFMSHQAQIKRKSSDYMYV